MALRAEAEAQIHWRAVAAQDIGTYINNTKKLLKRAREVMARSVQIPFPCGTELEQRWVVQEAIDGIREDDAFFATNLDSYPTWREILPHIYPEENMSDKLDSITNFVREQADKINDHIQKVAVGFPEDVRQCATAALDELIIKAQAAKEALTLADKPLPLIVYHKNCMDGTASAWAMSTYFGQTGAEYMDINPEDGGDVLKKELRLREVYFVDVCAAPAVLLAIAGRCRKLVVIDHHDSNLKALEKTLILAQPNFTLFASHDNTMSGAKLAWEYVHLTLRGKSSIPNNVLINYVDDYDRWQFKLPQSREVNAYIALKGYEISAYNLLNEECANSMDRIEDIGKFVVATRTALVNAQLKSLERREARHPDCIGHCIYGNCTALRNEVAEAALAANPDALYVHLYADISQADGSVLRVNSLRARQGSLVDVSAIAKLNGGGGHKTAAGYSVKL